jgi:hypothetical protein
MVSATVLGMENQPGIREMGIVGAYVVHMEKGWKRKVVVNRVN